MGWVTDNDWMNEVDTTDAATPNTEQEVAQFLPDFELVRAFGACFHCDVVDGNMNDLSVDTVALRDEILRRMGGED